ncbi:spermidine/putrescine ABC transporter permease [Primorskyibacter flagellatus]|uniref:Spermidine/putrescine ABC transporter permease n=2 Tax=Primorskyibacter flagellatus TaxID=1387277 RepID=A0A917EAM0_9RHOB|nr:spermidine/putrescine ABC transporter permease [Primorskyibacter flagellatus]
MRSMAHIGAALTAIFMLSPLVILVIFCFSESPLLAFPIEGWSLRWFDKAFSDPQFTNAFRNSMIVTGAVGVTSTLTGTLAALALAKLPPRLATATAAALSLPVMVPPLLLGVALLTFYSTWIGLPLGLPAVILSHLVFTQPLVMLMISARMASFDHAAVEAARDLGASPIQSFFHVTLPMIGPSITGGTLIAMALSLDDFLVTFFTIGGGMTLPTLMWGMLRKGIDPSVNVVAVTIMGLSIAATLIGFRLTRYRG